MTPKRPKARVSARGPKGNPAEKGTKRPRAKRRPNYPKGHPQHPEMLKAAKAAEREVARDRRETAKAAERAERARKAALPKPETISERAKRIKKETVEERGESWANESLSANLNDSRILQLRRLYAHMSEAKAKYSLSNVVKLETLIAKIQGTLDPAPVEDPDAEKGADGEVDPFPDKSDTECEYYAEVGYWPTPVELKDHRLRKVN